MKAQKIGVGNRCRRCGKTMIRCAHKKGWKPKKDQPYYFEYWDKCKCGMLQHYEAAKVMLKEKFRDPLEQEYRAIMEK